MARFPLLAMCVSLAVAFSLWVLLGLVDVGRIVPTSPTADRQVVRQPVMRRVVVPAAPDGWFVSYCEGGECRTVVELQRALIKKGFGVGGDGINGEPHLDTLSALQAFQDNHALSVQPGCDRQCWDALGYSNGQLIGP